MNKRALLSVADKTGLIELAAGLADLEWELIASGGTAAHLRDAGLIISDVSKVTGAPEMLGGRVKTLHPAIHGGILARDLEADRAELAGQGIGFIDLVVCNLYPFQETVVRPETTPAEAIEQIDIGGVTLLRAAAKNFARVTVICDPADYDDALAALRGHGAVSPTRRQALAAKAFAHTRDYDTAVANYLQQQTAVPAGNLPERLSLELVRAQALRYGENPHQAAALYAPSTAAGPLGGRLLQGKPLSYNNLLDLDAAWRTAVSFRHPTVVIVKHLTPCGVATAGSAAAAFAPALASDPVSAFGGVIAVNRPVDDAFADAVREAKLFIEAVAAPEFSPGAEAYFAARKQSCRLVMVADGDHRLVDHEMRTIRGGYLVQARDAGDPAGSDWQVVSQRQPTAGEWNALRFAWRAVQHVKSNAIVLAHESATVGIGGGLPSRIDAVQLAARKAGKRARGAVLASDAFFPFPDGIEAAAEVGVTAVIEPGGSIRDSDVIAAADRLGLALVFTGVRHFRH